MTIEDWKKEFAKRLKLQMLEKKIGCRKLSKLSGVNIQSIHNYLNAKQIPNCVQVLKLANAFGCNVSFLVEFYEPVIFDDVDK